MSKFLATQPLVGFGARHPIVPQCIDLLFKKLLDVDVDDKMFVVFACSYACNDYFQVSNVDVLCYNWGMGANSFITGL